MRRTRCIAKASETETGVGNEHGTRLPYLRRQSRKEGPSCRGMPGRSEHDLLPFSNTYQMTGRPKDSMTVEFGLEGWRLKMWRWHWGSTGRPSHEGVHRFCLSPLVSIFPIFFPITHQMAMASPTAAAMTTRAPSTNSGKTGHLLYSHFSCLKPRLAPPRSAVTPVKAMSVP
jgi:hypothetical protein